MPLPPRHSPFFILGADRSGTTLLRTILEARADVAIPPESDFIRDLHGWIDLDGSPTREQVLDLYRRLEQHPRFQSWQLAERVEPFDPSRMTRLAAYRRAMEAHFEAYSRSMRASRWGDKTPANLNAIDLLFRVWPDARIVFVERDGRDVYCSIRHLPFGPNSPAHAAVWWRQAIETRERAVASRPDAVTYIQYEDLVRDPDTVSGDLIEWLQLQSNQSSTTRPETRMDQGRTDWFPKLRRGLDQSSVGRWKKELSASELFRFESLCGPALSVAGYTPSSSRLLPGQGVRRMLLRELPRELLLKAIHFVQLRIVREHGQEVRYVLTRKLRRRAS